MQTVLKSRQRKHKANLEKCDLNYGSRNAAFISNAATKRVVEKV